MKVVKEKEVLTSEEKTAQFDELRNSPEFWENEIEYLENALDGLQQAGSLLAHQLKYSRQEYEKLMETLNS